ncbi:hypothetical protein D3C80_1183020 [compost metagenome]
MPAITAKGTSPGSRPGASWRQTLACAPSSAAAEAPAGSSTNSPVMMITAAKPITISTPGRMPATNRVATGWKEITP